MFSITPGLQRVVPGLNSVPGAATVRVSKNKQHATTDRAFSGHLLPTRCQTHGVAPTRRRLADTRGTQDPFVCSHSSLVHCVAHSCTALLTCSTRDRPALHVWQVRHLHDMVVMIWWWWWRQVRHLHDMVVMVVVVVEAAGQASARHGGNGGGGRSDICTTWW